LDSAKPKREVAFNAQIGTFTARCRIVEMAVENHEFDKALMFSCEGISRSFEDGLARIMLQYFQVNSPVKGFCWRYWGMPPMWA
jgi:hypothetical protein